MNKDSSKYIKEIADCLFKLKDEELKKGFWEIINYYNLDYLGILSNTNGYKEKLFPVSNIFNWLVNEDFYCIKRKINVICNSCKLNSIESHFIFPLVSISIKDLHFKSLPELLYSYYEPSSSSCEFCSFVNDKIKPNPFFWTCKNKFVIEINFPSLLTFIFDLSDEKLNEEKQYTNLIDLKDECKHLIVEGFEIENDKYKLIGTINMASINHYTACIYKNKYKIKNLTINKSYFYDGMKNNNILKEISEFDKVTMIDNILIFKPLLLFYFKNY